MQVIKRCRRPLPTSTILVPAEVNQVRSLVGHSLHSTPQVSSGRAEHDEGSFSHPDAMQELPSNG